MLINLRKFGSNLQKKVPNHSLFFRSRLKLIFGYLSQREKLPEIKPPLSRAKMLSPAKVNAHTSYGQKIILFCSFYKSELSAKKYLQKYKKFMDYPNIRYCFMKRAHRRTLLKVSKFEPKTKQNYFLNSALPLK